jgi:hypothetical protein
MPNSRVSITGPLNYRKTMQATSTDPQASVTAAIETMRRMSPWLVSGDYIVSCGVERRVFERG